MKGKKKNSGLLLRGGGKKERTASPDMLRLSLLILALFVVTPMHALQAIRTIPRRAGLRSLSMAKDSYKLVLVRHGESTWNDKNLFTGWYDCPLSVKGESEAISAGKLMKEGGLEFDLAYTSFLQRAIKTLWHGLEQTGCMNIPIRNAWQLNER